MTSFNCTVAQHLCKNNYMQCILWTDLANSIIKICIGYTPLSQYKDRYFAHQQSGQEGSVPDFQIHVPGSEHSGHASICADHWKLQTHLQHNVNISHTICTTCHVKNHGHVLHLTFNKQLTITCQESSAQPLLNKYTLKHCPSFQLLNPDIICNFSF